MKLNWQAARLRTTTFTPQNGMIDLEKLWQKLLKNSPEEIKNKPNLNFKEVIGDFKTGKLSIQSQGPRVDLFYLPIFAPDSKFPVIGPFEKCIVDFVSISEKLIKLYNFDPLRLAFGGEFFIPAKDKAAGYSTIAKILKNDVKVDAINSCDLLFQINKPRKSKVIKDLLINRLSKWAVFQISAVVASPEGMSVQPSNIACHLEIDINTSPETPSLPRSSLQNIYNELVKLGAEVINKGPVK